MQSTAEKPHWKRNAGIFIAGQFLSMFGSMLVTYSITWHVTLTRLSGGLMAVFAAASMLPMVLISPVAGVWADRYNRKHLVNGSDAFTAAVTLITAVFYSLGYENIWLLFAAVIARGLGQGIQLPAMNALIPQIVPAEHLTRFNGIQSAVQSLTAFGAPMAALAFLNFLPMEQIFYIDVVTAAVGIAAVFLCVKVPALSRSEERPAGIGAYLRETKEGLSFIASQPWLKTIFIASFLFIIFASPAAMLTPLQTARTFGQDKWRLASIDLAFSAGMVIGGLAVSVWGGFKNKAHTMIFAWLMFGVCTVLFGIIPNFWVYLAVMVLCGCIMPVYNTPCLTLMQSKIPPQIMGRVFSVLGIINGVGMPLGMALFGPLGDAVKIGWLLAATGTMLFAGGLILFGRKELLAAGESQPAAVTGNQSL